uniref:Homeobox protein cut-like n=1 Tax=Schistocephalus solidus TaxID=70667 RepID=A0A183S7K2_SCHSO
LCLFNLVVVEVLSIFSRSDEPTPQAASVTATVDAHNPAAGSSSADTLAAFQRAIAERDRALQNFQLRVIELERQLKAAHTQDQQSLQTENRDPSNSVLQAALEEKTAKLQAAEKRIQELEVMLKTLKTEKDNLQAEHTDLLLLLSDQDSQIADLTQKLEQQSLSVVAPVSAIPTSASTPQPVVTEALQNSSGSGPQSVTVAVPQNAIDPVSLPASAAVVNPPGSSVVTTASAVADTAAAAAYLAPSHQLAGETGHVLQPGYSTGSLNDYTGVYQSEPKPQGFPSAATGFAPVYPQTQWQQHPSLGATAYNTGAASYEYSSAVYAQTTMSASQPTNSQPGGYTAVSFGQS